MKGEGRGTVEAVSPADKPDAGSDWLEEAAKDKLEGQGYVVTFNRQLSKAHEHFQAQEGKNRGGEGVSTSCSIRSLGEGCRCSGTLDVLLWCG